MKKRYSILINVAIMCLCVCAIAFGVYSVKTANLSINGTISFQAHNTNIGLSGSIEACTSSEATARTKKTFSEANIGWTNEEYQLNLDTKFGGHICFSDLFGSGKTAVVTLEFTNNSDYHVEGTASLPTLTNSSAYTLNVKINGRTITGSTSCMIGKNKTATMVITIELANTESDVADVELSGNLFNFKPVSGGFNKTTVSHPYAGSFDINYKTGMTWGEWISGGYYNLSSLTNAYFDEAGTLVLCCEYEGSESQFTISGITATSTISNTAYEGEEYYIND